MFDPLDIVGVKYKSIEVVNCLPKTDKGYFYKCVCLNCKREHIKLRRYVIEESGCKSCAKKKDGQHATSKPSSPEYDAWKSMKRRCYKENCSSYEYYGARGIEVCDEWLNSFKKFYEDMGPKPSKDHSLDRRDNEGNYEPSNCRWATLSEQARNKRNTVLNKEMVREIKRLRMEEGLGAWILAKRFSVNVGTISNVLEGKTWVDIN